MTMQVPQELLHHTSRWTNPSKDKEVKVRIYTGTGEAKKDKHKNPSGYTLVVWAPGQTIELPSDYDNALQTIDATGQVVGGLAPQLLYNGKRRPLHPSLNVAETDAVTAKEALLALSIQKADLEARLKVAEEKALGATAEATATTQAEDKAIVAAKEKDLAEQHLKLERDERERLERENAELRARLEAADAAKATEAAAKAAEVPPAAAAEAPAEGKGKGKGK